MPIHDMNQAAILSGDTRLSYQDLFTGIEQYARALGLAPGARVVVFSENRIEWPFLVFAIWRCQAICIPMDAMSSADDLAYMIGDCTPDTVICSGETRPVLDEALAGLDVAPRVLDVAELAVLAAGQDPATDLDDLPALPADNTAFIIYTSGTTGKPKGVMLSYDNIRAMYEAVCEECRIITADQRAIVMLPTHHILPLLGTIVLPLMAHGSIAFSPSLESTDIIETLGKHGVTMMVGVPLLYNKIRAGIEAKIKASPVARLLFALARTLRSKSFSRTVFRTVHKRFGGKLTYMVSGGAALDPETASFFLTLGFEVLEGYGMTETSPIITFTRPGTTRPGSAGQTTLITEARIKDGEIVCRGRNVMQGYLNRPEETAEIIRDGWLHTGDLGEFSEDGFLTITGRRKEIIVLPNGKNLNPEEAEKALLGTDPGVLEAAVVERDQGLHAVIRPDVASLRERGVLGLEDHFKERVLGAYNKRVTPYKRISGFTLLSEELPKTRLGKIKRFQLAAMIAQGSVQRKDVPEPEVPSYGMIRDFINTHFGRDAHAGDHLEIDLKLDSLDRVTLQSFIQAAFGVDVKESDLSANPHLGELAVFVSEHQTRQEEVDVDWGEVLNNPPMLTLPSSSLMHRTIKSLSRLTLKTVFRIKGEGVENLPDGPFIIAPNHQSFLDGLLVMIHLRGSLLKRFYFFAKRKHFSQKWRAFLARKNNILIMDINKDLKSSLQKMAAVLKNGRSLIIFPEGTRSRDGDVGNFKRAFAILSRELNVPVVPVVIDGAHKALPRGSFFLRPFRRIHVRFLPPVYPDPEHQNYDSLMEQVRGCIVESIATLRNQAQPAD